MVSTETKNFIQGCGIALLIIGVILLLVWIVVDLTSTSYNPLGTYQNTDLILYIGIFAATAGSIMFVVGHNLTITPRNSFYTN